MDDAATASRSSRALSLLLVLITAVFIAGGLRYALFQNLWIDESTQLSGVTLPPMRLLEWLTGTPEPGFGVPPDRTPPLSYLLDIACARTACTSPFGFRLFHLFIASAGVVILLREIGKRYGMIALVVAGAFLALSPKLSEIGVEIRSYPIFFLITCVQIVLLGRAVDRGLSPGIIAGMMLAGIAAIFTHFFGMISSFALLGGLFVSTVRKPRDALIVIGMGIGLLLAATGLLPFVLHSTTMSTRHTAPPVDLVEFITYALKLFGHAANMMVPSAAAVFFGAVAILLAVGGLRGLAIVSRDRLEARHSLVAALIAAVIAGVAVTCIAALVVKHFDALAPHYSIWTFPMLATLLGAAVARLPNAGWIRAAALGGGVLLVIGAAWAQALFLTHAAWFVHGPSSAIIASVHPEKKSAVIYRGDWGYGFFPVYQQFREGLPQWLLEDDGRLHRLKAGGAVDKEALLGDHVAGMDKLIVVDIRTASYSELGEVYRNGHPAPVTFALPPVLSGWQVDTSRILPGLYWAQITELKPKTAPALVPHP